MSTIITIAEGDFLMGDPNAGTLAHPVYLSEYLIDGDLVSYGVWKAINDGSIRSGRGKADSHPVYLVHWVDACRWCNLRSQHDGLLPAYMITPEGKVSAVWKSDGWRLPTEAEWEKAARGGKTQQLFPWGNTINGNQANYLGQTYFPYDRGPNGYAAKWKTLPMPYTSPIRSYPPNDYGLSDPVGNMNCWCWDWYDSTYYSRSPAVDPIGPDKPGVGYPNAHVARGGNWGAYAGSLRVGSRSYAVGAGPGLRCVRHAIPQAVLEIPLGEEPEADPGPECVSHPEKT